MKLNIPVNKAFTTYDFMYGFLHVGFITIPLDNMCLLVLSLYKEVDLHNCSESGNDGPVNHIKHTIPSYRRM